MIKYKKGDEVVVSSGKDKGKKGKIEKVLANESKVVVTGINTYKRHRKASRNQPAGIFEITRPVNFAKVSIVCPKCGKPTRVGIQTEDKSKNRYCKKCKGVL